VADELSTRPATLSFPEKCRHPLADSSMKNDHSRASRLASLLLLFCLGLSAHLAAAAAPDPANYRLTEATLSRLQALEAELKPAGKNKQSDKQSDKQSGRQPAEAATEPDGEGEEGDEADSADEADTAEDDTVSPAAGSGRGPDGKKDESVEGIAAKVEAHPQIKAALAKQGLTPMDYALAVHAMLHAGMFVMFESAMDPQKAQALLSTYTPAQRENIEVVRRSATMKR
jgi:hypothetical protein